MDRVLLRRPRVDALLHAAWERRVVLVAAGPGYGKSTALAALAATGQCHVVRAGAADELIARVRAALGVPETMAAAGVDDPVALAETRAAQLCAALDGRADELLIVDEVERAADDAGGVAFLRALCLQAPTGLHLVLSGRAIPPLGLGDASGRGELARVGATDLAFTPDEVRELVARRLDDGRPELADEIAARTAGWPAAVCLFLDALARTGAATVVGDAPSAWHDFAAAIVAGLPDGTRRLLTAAAAGVAEVPLLRALGVEASAAELDELVERGLLVREPRRVSDVLLAELADDGTWRQQAAAWFEQHGRLAEAFDRWPADAVRGFLERRGHQLVAAGAGRRVADQLRALGAEDEPSLALLGEALWASGDWDGAADAFGRVYAAADGMPVAAAWQFGALLYLRGDVDTAVDVLRTARPGAAADGALASAWLASALWSRGEVDDAEAAATRADAEAIRCGDSRARAAAQVAVALVAASRGDRERNAQAYRAALAAATEAGDSMQASRIHANLASKAIEEGDYRAAVECADRAVQVGAGQRFFTALALTNKGEALLRLGELDAARAAVAEAYADYRALGSLGAAAALVQLAEIHRQRGADVQARLAFEGAARTAEAGGDAHAAASALTGLAWLLGTTEPISALAHAHDAVAGASGLERAAALVAQAWVELNGDDPEAAARTARDAEEQARATDDRPTLIAAIQVRAVTTEPPDAALLAEALALCEEVGDPIAAIRARQAIAAARGDDAEVDVQRRLLLDRGAAELGVAAWLVRRMEGRTQTAPAITTLGAFTVTVGGRPVPLAAWQSRKARDLLKLVVASEGRPVPRDAAAEALWPGQPPDRLGNRLSVALSTVRRVLDPDRMQAVDHYVTAELALRTDRVRLDLTQFLAAATAAHAAAEAGDSALADRRCADAELLYRGDFLEEDRYADWALNCRERARAAADTILRLRARTARLRGDPEAAATYLLRLVERDPYDEDSWTALIALHVELRRHGEARRLFSGYSRRMAELDIAPTPFARLTRSGP